MMTLGDARAAPAAARLAGLFLVLAAALAGCALAASSTPDPVAPCGGAEERRGTGLEPELEALLPATIEGVAPSQSESGSYCSARALGLLAEAGFDEIRFAGATWPGEDGSGLAVVVYRAPGLTLDAVADSFARGADDARSVNQVHAVPTEVAGRQAVRIDAFMRREPQSVVIWPSAASDTVIVVIGSRVSDDHFEAAVAAMGER